MKILKRILFVIVIIIALPLIIALFVKKDYAVERDVVINKSVEEVFDYVKYLKNQDNYSRWALMDPEMEKSYSGTDGTAGFISAWDSDNKEVGKGEQEIMQITDGKQIDYELRFYEPFESTDKAYMTTEMLSENETKVKWGFRGKVKYPMNIMFLFMDMEELIGNDLGTGLEKLKQLLEEQN